MLVATLPGVDGEVRIAAVTAIRRLATTRPGDSAAPEPVRAAVRSLGIAAVTGTFHTYEPFPGEGSPAYEVTIAEDDPVAVQAAAPLSPAAPAHAAHASVRPVTRRYVAGAEAVAAVIAEWAQAARQRTPPGPRSERDLRRLRALAQAKRESLAVADWARVATLHAEGRLAASWQVAGLAVAFDPEHPDAGIDAGTNAPSPQPQPASATQTVTAATTLAQQVVRRLAASGLEAIFDVGAMTGRLQASLEQMLSTLPAPGETATAGTVANAPAAPTLTPAARATLRDDLDALDPRQLLWHLPRDAQGRLLLGEQVLLASYDSSAPLSQGRRVWLVAALPAKRHDAQMPTLRLASLIGANHTHRWDEARWRWDGRAHATPVKERWGVPSPAAGTRDTQADRCLLLQDAGRFEEALALYDIELSPEVAQLVRGEPLGWQQRELAAPWAQTVQEAVRDAALWRLGPLLVDAAAARARWLAEKRGRKRPLPELRLLRLPKQTWQRKAVLTVAARVADGGHPWLTLTWTGAEDRLPAVAWRRDVDLDLLRLGLLAPADLPYAVQDG